MKGNYLYIVVGFVLASMLACTKDTPEIGMADAEASRIYLSAGVSGTVSSRVPYHPTDGSGNVQTVPTASSPLDVSVWASTTSGVFPNSGETGSTGTVAIHTDARFQSGSPQLLGKGDILYPQNNGTAVPVYFVGLHPKSVTQSSWTTSDDNKKANFTFTGKEDVMFAPQIEGKYGTAFENSPKFHFHHLLTWLRIEMVADKSESDVRKREAVRDAWGKITSMTISSKNQVTVDLSGTTFSADNVSFGETTANFKFYQTGSDNEFPVSGGSLIPTTNQNGQEVAYVMCAPVACIESVFDQGIQGNVNVPEYTIRIETENRGQIDIPIDLKGTDGNPLDNVSTLGKQFTILLNFKMGNVISVAAGISLTANAEWYTHGTGTGELTEDLFTSNTSNKQTEQ